MVIFEYWRWKIFTLHRETEGERRHPRKDKDCSVVFSSSPPPPLSSSLFSVERISIVKIGIASRNVPRPRQMNLLKYTRNSTSVQYLHGPTGHGQDIYPETRDASRLNLATRLLSLLRGPCGFRFYCWKVFSVPLSLLSLLVFVLCTHCLLERKENERNRRVGKEKKKMRRGGPRGNTERERGRAVFLEGRKRLDF